VTPLVSVPRGASAEEVAAMVAVVAVLEAERAAASAGAATAEHQLDAWVRASRVSARGGTFTRGSWRLAGRLARRARA
jgi:hypothetical protein